MIGHDWGGLEGELARTIELRRTYFSHSLSPSDRSRRLNSTPRSKSPVDPAEIVRLHDEGLSLRRIASLVGVNHETVWSRMA